MHWLHSRVKKRMPYDGLIIAYITRIYLAPLDEADWWVEQLARVRLGY